MRKIVLFVCFTLVSMYAYCSHFENLPTTITQPNGVVVNCFVTGDEYYSWLHDANNFTIVQNSNTGYYCYALLQNDELVPSIYSRNCESKYCRVGFGCKL